MKPVPVSEYTMKWIFAIGLATLLLTAATIIWWPGWFIATTSQLALAGLGVYFIKTDPEYRKANDS